MTSNNNQVASWPYDPEIFYHLDYVPFIDLKFSFNTAELLKEATSLLPKSVIHRESNQRSLLENHYWKSLGLRTFQGDPYKTEYHTKYSNQEILKPYQNTEFLKVCPNIAAFLTSLTEIENCDRIRIMILEPGVEILTHRDSQTRDVSLAINISLNMPDHCEFWCDLNSDGSLNEYSKKVPFSDTGSVVLFNNAKFHKLVNNSNIPRIHIIFHGPTKFSDEYILKMARTQNNLFNRKELLKKLIFKKCFLGESFAKTPNLQIDWAQSGLEFDIFSNYISIVVIKHSTDSNNPIFDEAYLKFTSASLFPLKFTSLFESELDSFLNSPSIPITPFLVICTAGTFIKDLHLFIFELFSQINSMKNANAIVAGHILDYQDDRLPFFHEQFLIINWNAWKEEKLAPLGTFFSQKKMTFVSYVRGEDFHDGYTPKFLKPIQQNEKTPPKMGYINWGTQLVFQCLSKNYSILNINENLRNCKIYSYPTELNHAAYFEIKKRIGEMINSAKEDVYFFNNENLSIPIIDNLNPTKIISVAAGFKSIKIFEQYKINSNHQIVYVDFSKNSLNYIKKISTSKNASHLIKLIDQFIKIINPKYFKPDFSKNLLTFTIKEFFENDELKFFHHLNLAQNATFLNIDIVSSPDAFVDLLKKGDRFIIWISNVFYNTHLFHAKGEPASEQLFLELIVKISTQLNTKSFLQRNTRSVIFGSSIREPIGFLTDGAIQNMSQLNSDYIVIN